MLEPVVEVGLVHGRRRRRRLHCRVSTAAGGGGADGLGRGLGGGFEGKEGGSGRERGGNVGRPGVGEWK